MFLDQAPESPAVRALFDDERATDGYVSNHTRLWAWRPDVNDAFMTARAVLQGDTELTGADIAVVNTAAAAARDSAYCALAWGTRLAGRAGAEAAGAVIAGGAAPDERLSALADWARTVAAAPASTTAGQVERLRAAGLSDRAVFEATMLAAWRTAFAAVNDALGARPDRQLLDDAPAQVTAVVRFGREPGDTHSV
jgi:alkylhydroperoxidase family enzyme